MYNYKVDDVTKLWDMLGSFWGGCQNKELIQAFWEGYQEVATECSGSQAALYLSQFISKIKPVLVDTKLIYENVTLYNTKYYKINIDNILSMEGLKINGTTVTDYEINKGNIIELNVEIPEDVEITIDTVYYLNPIFYNIYLTMLEFFEKSDYPYFLKEIDGLYTYDYPSELRVYEWYNILYLIWGICILRMKEPTIYNLKKIFMMASGYPFAFKSGTITAYSDTLNTVTVDDLVYEIDSSLIPYVKDVGTELSEFDSLIEDAVYSETLASGVSTTASFSFNHYNVDLGSSLNTNEDFLNKVMNEVVPHGITY